ncbi:UDP-N-acetylmuramoyl-L-alanine--D-glutamate ligase [Halanaerobium hydrogeniformans]|uniref:UDP-N-acetylmuramoylalanine--D-glutamate ligase n=1 Tax=Halanaerobium hydrogeniformans TaxID=656519 RepID=E4RIG1_HALHG|nr:UDP-N-acetylmuramoyl-L-alanine--D-glutamate ligase [Halanaerobium hydrogeniformans]ADQ15031.1 UDP-N-acetylmuramoylalanine/D-glutamate ligase [Halanaerobium hydrogeniformans]
MQLKNKKVAIVGLSRRTGLALVKYLDKYGAKIIVSDSKSSKELEPIMDELREIKNLSYDLGGNTKAILEAELIILSPGVPYDLEILKEARTKGIETISEIEFAYRMNEADIIAVTGTNGKTTTTDLLAKMLNKLNGRKVQAAGNIGIPFISIVEQMGKDDLVVLELSSFQLEAVKNFHPKIALYLNYSPDHLDRHKSEENYKNAKKKIFSQQNRSDYALIDLDDKYLAEIKNQIKAELFTISAFNKKADVIIENNKAILQKNGEDKKQELIDFDKLNFSALHNKKNITFAALAAYLSGQKLEKIKHAAQKYELKSHRMEKIDNDRGYLIIDDSKATNPSAALNAVKSLDRDIILIAGGQDRGADFSQLAEEIKKRVSTLILIGETSDKLAAAVGESNLEIFKAENMEKAAEIAAEKLSENNCLLLSPACPSWDMFESYKIRGDSFRKHVLKNLN